MTNQLSRLTLQNATLSGPVAGQMIVIGHIIDCEPEMPIKREILRLVEPDEPDTEVEVGYSKNALEPLTIVFQDRKVELTILAYRLFRYVNDLYRLEGQTEFDFAELSEALTGDEFGMSRSALGTLIRRLDESLETIVPPFTLNTEKETLYVCNKFVAEK
jgi:hypothetical protein